MQKKTYPKAFKKEVVQFYERNHTIAETRAKYGISESTLFDWKRKYDEEHFLYVPGPGQKNASETRRHISRKRSRSWRCLPGAPAESMRQ